MKTRNRLKILQIKRIESKTAFILSKICNMPFLLSLHLEGCLCVVCPHCLTTSATTIRISQSPIHHCIYHWKRSQFAILRFSSNSHLDIYFIFRSFLPFVNFPHSTRLRILSPFLSHSLQKRYRDDAAYSIRLYSFATLVI